MEKQLFKKQPLHQYFAGLRHFIINEIQSLPEGYLQSNDDQKIIDHYYSTYSVKPLQVDWDNAENDPSTVFTSETEHPLRPGRPGPVETSVRSHLATITIPYYGPPILWELTTSNSPFSDLTVQLTSPTEKAPGTITFTLHHPVGNGAERLLPIKMDREVEIIKSNLDAQQDQINLSNLKLKSFIHGELKKRRKEVDELRKITTAIAIPLKREKNFPNITIPLEENIVQLNPPTDPTEVEPNRRIERKNFNKIVSFIRHVGKAFERMPNTFSKFGEIHLRDIIASFLNGYFKARVTTETFRRVGRTDILVQEEDRTAFIGECKIWGGDKKFSKSIDQLFKYHTWRDCKSALIFFCQVKDISKVEKKIPKLIREHNNYKRGFRIIGSSEWQCVFQHPRGEHLEIICRIFIFHIDASVA